MSLSLRSADHSPWPPIISACMQLTCSLPWASASQTIHIYCIQGLPYATECQMKCPPCCDAWETCNSTGVMKSIEKGRHTYQSKLSLLWKCSQMRVFLTTGEEMQDEVILRPLCKATALCWLRGKTSWSASSSGSVAKFLHNSDTYFQGGTTLSKQDQGRYCWVS